jgi:hypothetical protein
VIWLTWPQPGRSATRTGPVTICDWHSDNRDDFNTY